MNYESHSISKMVVAQKPFLGIYKVWAISQYKSPPTFMPHPILLVGPEASFASLP